jgi:putative DNA primase/helicase
MLDHTDDAALQEAKRLWQEWLKTAKAGDVFGPVDHSLPPGAPWPPKGLEAAYAEQLADHVCAHCGGLIAGGESRVRWHGEAWLHPACKAGIPFIITHQMKADLAARGFSAEQIHVMTPIEARAHLTISTGAQPAASPASAASKPAINYAVACTIFKSNERLSKQYTLAQDGKTIDKNGATQLWSGTYQVLTVTAVIPRLLRQIGSTLDKLTYKEAIGLGVPKDGATTGGITTQGKVENGTAPAGAIPRDLEHFGWPNKHALLFFDGDEREGMFEILSSIYPPLAEVAMLVRPSVSASVVNPQTGKALKTGEHGFVVIDKPSRSRECLHALMRLAWVHGQGTAAGWLGLTACGDVLIKGPIDLVVGSPERLVYEGAGAIGKGIKTSPRVSQVIGGSGMLNADELVAYAKAHAPESVVRERIAAAKTDPAFIAKRDAVIAAYRDTHIAKGKALRVKKGMAADKAEKEAIASYDAIIAAGTCKAGRRTWRPLADDHVLYWPDGGSFTVADIKAQPLKFHNKECADPIEGLDYQSKNPAIIYTNHDDQVEIYSRAHSDRFAYVAPLDETPWDVVFERLAPPSSNDALPLIVKLGIKLWGPTTLRGKEYLFGADQSKTVDLRGMWFDFTNNQGGGIKELMRKVGQADRGQTGNAVMVCAADVKMRGLDWIWPGHLLRGSQETISGMPDLGKSQVQCAYVACATNRLPWPDGAPPIEPVNVIMMTAEDTLDQILIPRLAAAGADLSRVRILKGIRIDEKRDRQFLLAEDLHELERAAIEIGNVGLITIDPITAYMGGKMDSHKATEVRSQLGPLKDLAERLNTSVSTLTHPAKNAGQRALDQFIGSQAFIAACRIGHLCVEERREDVNGVQVPTGRVLFTTVRNAAGLKKPTLAFRKVVVEAGRTGEGLERQAIMAPKVIWDGVVDITADAAVGAAAGSGGQGHKGEQPKVQRFLRDLLADGKPVTVKEVEAAAAKHGFTTDQLRTARQRLGIVPFKEPGVMGGGWLWQLDQAEMPFDAGVNPDTILE